MEDAQLLQDNETVILTVRKHWSVLIGTFLAALLVVVVPLFAISLIKGIDPFLLHLFWFFYFITIALLWVGCGFTIADFLLDAWIITDTRIIDIEQSGLFNRRVSTIALKNIQNIVCEVSGIVQTVLRTGTLTIESAGEHAHDTLLYVPYPDQVKQIILDTSAKTK